MTIKNGRILYGRIQRWFNIVLKKKITKNLIIRFVPIERVALFLNEKHAKKYRRYIYVYCINFVPKRIGFTYNKKKETALCSGWDQILFLVDIYGQRIHGRKYPWGNVNTS